MRKFRFDYSQTMMMKLDIGIPDNKGGCKLFCTFEQALDKIKKIDALTLGAPKIIYLVGWQYSGHDDKYPAFFEVNEQAKRPCDKTALDSLLWLIESAKQYHTTVSLHINLSDAYPDSPLWDAYIQNDLILRDFRGALKVTGTWNGRKAYQVRFKAEYESGFFQKRVDMLLHRIPLDKIGTVHVDAFFVRRGKNTSIRTEKEYRRKMIEYFMEQGVDVTSEFIYREWPCGYRSFWGKSDIVGLIPAIWHLRMTQRDYLRYPPQLLAGGKLNMDLQWDRDLQYLFYGNTHGEDCFFAEDRPAEFTEKFALGSVPYLFLNRCRLQKITGFGKKRQAWFSNGVVTRIADKSITENGMLLKQEDTLCIPLAWKKDTYYAWSKSGGTKSLSVCGKSAEVFEVTENGPVLLDKIQISGGTVLLEMKPGAGYAIQTAKQPCPSYALTP